MEHNTNQYYQLKAEIIKAAAHPIRLAIIESISDYEKCVYDITCDVKAQRTNVSRHLSLLQKAGLLKSRKDGLNIYYSLKTPCILKFLACIDDLIREKIESESAILDKITKGRQ